MQDFDDDDRAQVIGGVVGKVIAVAIGIGLVIGLGTYALVKVLDLNEDSGTTTVSGSGPANDTPLPTTALPGTTDTKTPDPGDTATPGQPPAGKGMTLAVSPAFVKPMERINLTGTYAGKDSVDLQVQRKEDGVWTDFPATVGVHVGSFATYVLTGRAGENQFRVLDTQTNKASNPVTVNVG